MAKTNYQYEKRQKELDKKKKKAEKERLKQIRKTIKPEENPAQAENQASVETTAPTEEK